MPVTIFIINKITSKIKTPNDQTSIDHGLLKFFFLQIISGGKYSGVAIYYFPSFSYLCEDPKSIIFSSWIYEFSILTKIFSGFISLWTIFRSDNTSRAY